LHFSLRAAFAPSQAPIFALPDDTDGRTVELRCNECGTVVGVINRGVLEDLVWLVNATKVQ
jgi:hypothetical protein